MKTYIHPSEPVRNHDVTRLYKTTWWRGLRDWRIYRHIENYCMFLGYPRSGHSLVGALMDAHPNIAIANEADALGHMAAGFRRHQLYALLMMRAAEFAASGCQGRGYTYAVPNQWQGKVEKLKAIGDKKGGLATQWLTQRPELLAQLRAEVRVPLKLIHVVRNPFDNIATMFTRKHRSSLEESAEMYFSLCATVRRTIDENPQDVITIRHEDVIADPTTELRSLVQFLGLDCTEQYLRDCASIVFSSPKQTRNTVNWPAGLRERVERGIAGYDFLKGYSFVSETASTSQLSHAQPAGGAVASSSTPSSKA